LWSNQGDERLERFEDMLLILVFIIVTIQCDAIEEYIRFNNENPKPFVWTKRAEDIIKKVSNCKATIETLH
jgi:hypothetical protein